MWDVLNSNGGWDSGVKAQVSCPEAPVEQFGVAELQSSELACRYLEIQQLY